MHGNMKLAVKNIRGEERKGSSTITPYFILGTNGDGSSLILNPRFRFRVRVRFRFGFRFRFRLRFRHDKEKSKVIALHHY